MGRRKRELQTLRTLQRDVWGHSYFDAFYGRDGATDPSRLGRALAVATIVLGGSLVASGVGATAAQATKPNPLHKVTLCHRTASYTNPYVVITVDVASVLRSGHDTHNGPVFFPAIPKHQKWGDIIPPFNFGPNATYAGKNWTAAGRAVFDNHCKIPTVATTTTTPSTSTSSTTTATIPVTTSTSVATSSSTAPSTSSSTITPTSTASSTTSSSVSPSSTAASTTVPGTVTTAGGPSTSIEGASSTSLAGAVGTLGGPTTPATNAPGATQAGPLPRTGAGARALIVFGLSLMGAGSGLIVRRRARA